jgi:hypothetical protein
MQLLGTRQGSASGRAQGILPSSSPPQPSDASAANTVTALNQAVVNHSLPASTAAGSSAGGQSHQHYPQADVGTALQALQGAQERLEATLADVSRRQVEAEAHWREERQRLEAMLGSVLQAVQGKQQ